MDEGNDPKQFFIPELKLAKQNKSPRPTRSLLEYHVSFVTFTSLQNSCGNDGMAGKILERRMYVLECFRVLVFGKY